MKLQNKLIASLVVVVGLALISTSQIFAQSPPAPPPAGGTLEQRIAQRKAERKITLDKKDQARLLGRCVQGQGKIRSIQQKATNRATTRANVYQRIDAKLWVVIGQLKLAKSDTFTLQKQRTTLAEKVAALQTTSGYYRQTLDDLLVINCEADLVGFKALLETARLYQAQQREQSAVVRNLIVNDIKANLANHANELRPKQAGEEQ